MTELGTLLEPRIRSEPVRLKVKRSALPLLTVALAWFRWGALGRKASSVDEDKILTTQTSEAPSRQSTVISKMDHGEAMLMVFLDFRILPRSQSRLALWQ